MKKLLNVLPARAYLRLKWNYARFFERKAFSELQKLRLATTVGLFSYSEFDEKKVIFVHIPKCAGIAVKEALFEHPASGSHTTISTYCRIFEPELFLSYFKFTFIRNPWDRLVSAYHYLRAGGYGAGDKNWFERELSIYRDFGDFVHNWLRAENIHKHIHFFPQVEFLKDETNKNIRVDYIGFYENLENDFSYIAKRLGVDRVVQRRNASAHKSYKDYYCDATREIVRKVYLRDIETFGYDFENANIAAQIARRDATLEEMERYSPTR